MANAVVAFRATFRQAAPRVLSKTPWKEVADNGYHGLHKKFVDRFGIRGEALWTFVACSLASPHGERLRSTLLLPKPGTDGLPVLRVSHGPQCQPAQPHHRTLRGGRRRGISLAIFGLLDVPGVLETGVSLARVGAGTLSVALTGAILLLLRSSHPPAGATTLIVSLGFLQTPREMLAFMVSVVILIIIGWGINRAVGVPAPVWACKE